MAEKDFQYVIEDFNKLYIGAKNTYQGLVDNEDAPMKLRTILLRFMMSEVAGDTTIENHLFYLKKDSLSYQYYKKLRARFKLNIWDPGKRHYISKVYSLDEILDTPQILVQKDSIIVDEMIVTKLALMSVVL